MVNVSLALAFIISWASYYFPNLSWLSQKIGLPLFQIAVVLFPFIFLITLFKLTSANNWIKLNKLTLGMLAIANCIVVLALIFHTVQPYFMPTEPSVESIMHQSSFETVPQFISMLYPFAKILSLTGIFILLLQSAQKLLTHHSSGTG